MKRAFFLFFLPSAVIALSVVGYQYRHADESAFPYGRTSDGVVIERKDPGLGAANRSAYLIKSGDIEGEAVVTPAPMKNAAQSMINAEMVGVRSTFQSSRAPYGGHITAFIDCESNKYLKEQNVSFAGARSEMILAVATARRIFGSCSADQIKFASVFWAGYDEVRKQVLTVKLFKPVSNPAAVEASQQEILKVFQKVIGHPGGT